MNPCIGPAAAMDDDIMADGFGDAPGQDFLDRKPVGLDLPSGISGPIVGESQGVGLGRCRNARSIILWSTLIREITGAHRNGLGGNGSRTREVSL